MTTEYASAGTMSGDESLPSVIRIFIFTDEKGRAAAAGKIRGALEEFVPGAGAEVYEDVMPDGDQGSSMQDEWLDANPGADVGERARQRITIVVPGLSHAELADLSAPLAGVVSPGWGTGVAAERAHGEGSVPCRVAVGRADEQPGTPPAAVDHRSV
ncbi:hypothetical protein ACFORJ_09105 [Corynebacterium hansenii]|uniref:Uncharacterized protein n=1 Tax=Corynebacterium hansenii TaxID=394964 RepID=A0ABV7ZT65_9CORY|nr:hypothetical protein [Corynebacterium hansenii]WJZ00910.1 hypothetical protein CHAN_11595 [Corynebacterium hansenii]